MLAVLLLELACKLIWLAAYHVPRRYVLGRFALPRLRPLPALSRNWLIVRVASAARLPRDGLRA